jgi:hypothetical protein
MEPTSIALGSAPISRHAPVIACSMIVGTVIPSSFPNFDW